MNELYTFVEQAFRNYTEASVLRLLAELSNNPGQKSDQFGLPANYEYVVKRFIGAILAKDPNLKFNAHLALTAIAKSLSEVKTESLFEYIAGLSNYKKHCDGKATEIEAYVIGKILAFKALKSIFAGSLTVIANLSILFTEFAEYEEQIIELIFELTTDKKSFLQFSKIVPTTKSGFVLHSILKSKFKKVAAELNQNVISDVLKELVVVYPKRSICIDHLAPLIKTSIEDPAKYFEQQFDTIFQDNSDVNVRLLYYVLQLLAGHLKDIKLTSENVWSIVSVKVLGGWILQLKVKNKHIRRLAQNISIQFDNDATLAFNILSELHQKSLYLENINHKHPLFKLYENVQPHQYTQYLLDLIAKDTNQEDEEKGNKGYYNELEVFLVTRHKELTIEEISQIITIFINRYRENEEESTLQAINTIFNALLSFNPKKTQLLQNRASLILSKISIEQLELGEQQGQIKNVIKKVRNIFKTNKQEKDVFNISFYNFLLSVAYYFLVYPEEVELFSDLEMAEKEIKANILFSESGLQSKKKRKLNGDSDKNKPIHILVDIFISLLTKSSQFLRATINHLFEQVIPYIDGSDISHLLEVISKPDAEFVENIQAEE